MSEPASILSTHNLTIGYRSGNNAKIISENLNLNLNSGQLVCLLGPNGAGKSTLMRTLAGLQPALSGEIMLGGQMLLDFKPAELAKELSLVLTERIEAGNLTVNEVVSLGRTPYTGWLGTLSNLDQEKINQALTVTETATYRDRRIHQLSDGERQKVMLARALAQDTNLIILDEPTAHLDLPSRVEMMHLLHMLARETNKAILLSTHELDLALQAADQLWLMKQDGEMTTGIPEDLVLNGSFESAFAKTGFYFNRSSGTFTIHPEEVSFNINLSGNTDLVFWTKRALQREGIGTNNSESLTPEIFITEQSNEIQWKLDWYGTATYYTKLETLIDSIRLKRSHEIH